MRVLFAFVGGSGHREPLVPIARAAETAGHTAAFTCRPSMGPGRRDHRVRGLRHGAGQLGLAEALDAVHATPQTVRDQVTAVLAGASYRRKAERERDEIASLPDSATAVVLLEQLLSEKRPLLSNWPQPRKL